MFSVCKYSIQKRVLTELPAAMLGNRVIETRRNVGRRGEGRGGREGGGCSLACNSVGGRLCVPVLGELEKY